MLPGESGLTLVQQLRANAATENIPVMMLTAKGTEFDKVCGLDAGADDYLTKPFDTGELLARLEAVLRRSAGAVRADEALLQNGRAGAQTLSYKDITMYPEDFTAYVGGTELPLTRREYLILELLMENPGKVFTRNNIYESVWNEEFLGEDNAVNVHISNIRQKLAKLHPEESYIQTVWGIGFKMK